MPTNVLLTLPLNGNLSAQLNVSWNISVKKFRISHFIVKLFSQSNISRHEETVTANNNQVTYNYTFISLTPGKSYYASIQSFSPDSKTSSNLSYSNKQKTSK